MKKWFNTFCFALGTLFAGQAQAAQAVDFAFTDTKGKSIRLSDYQGKWVLVNFWAPWCPRCKMEFPELNDLDARNDFVVIGVAMDYGIDEGSVHSTIQRYNLRYPQIIGGNRRDPNSPALQVGPVDFYPTSYLYAPNGEIVMFVPGIISKQKIIAFTGQYQPPANSALANAAPAATPTTKSGVQKASMRKAVPQSKAQDKKKATTIY
ncbi:MAG: TlpA family protein disulfide reductase [Thiobacillus sp.]